MTIPASTIATRRWIQSHVGLLVACTAGVVLQLYALLFQPVGRVTAQGRHVILLNELGAGGRVAEAFQAEADGLSEVDVWIGASGSTAMILDWRVSAVRGAQLEPIYQASLPLDRLSGVTETRLRLPTIDASAGRFFAIEVVARDVRAADGGARPEITLAASRDKPRNNTYLLVDGRERWGSLRFDTRSVGDTVLGQLRLHALPRLPPAFRSVVWILVGLAILDLAALLVVVGVVQSGSMSTGMPIEATSAARPAGLRLALGVAGGLVIAVGLLAALTGRATTGQRALIDDLWAADLTSSAPLHDAIAVRSVEIGVERRRAILAETTSRLVWHVSVAPDTHFRTAVAIDPGAWTGWGDGVVFRVRAVQDGTETELFTRLVNPRVVAADQRWIPVDLDLSPFAGRRVDVVLLTEPSLPGRPPDSSYDWALWGEPRLVSSSSFLQWNADRVTAVQ